MSIINKEKDIVIKKEVKENINNEYTNDNVLSQNNFVEYKTLHKHSKARIVLKEYFKNLFSTKLFLLIISIIMLLKTILLYKTSMFNNKQLTVQYIYMAFAYMCIFMAIPVLLKNKFRFWFAIIIDFAVSIFLCINEIYYSYSSNLISISQISNLQYGREISVALPNLVHIWQLCYFIDIIVILIIYFMKKDKLFNKKCISKKQKFLLYVPNIIYCICIIFLALYIDKNWLQKAQTHQYNKVQQIEASSIYGYEYLDIKNNVNMKKNVKYKTKNAMFSDYNDLMQKYNDNYNMQYDFNEIAKDKNVIIVQLESVQNFVVNRTINGQEITPNLNKFINENIEFSNMQNQSYSSTADSEYAVMNSIYPLENGMSFAQYSSNDYDDIYKNFKNENYITTYIHGNEGDFWNRKSVYSRLNIDNLIFDNIFDKNVERINEYVSDEAVYRKIVEEIKNYNDKFFVNIVSASSHIAFDLPGIENKEEKVKLDVGEKYKNMFFGNYLEAVNYADYAFGILINELKNADLYEDTVILVYGDHAGLQMYNDEMIEFIKETEQLNDIQTQINYSNILCGLKIPGVGSLKINKPVSKIDIKPTLEEVCGAKDEFSLGKSMFSDKDFVCLNNGKIITEKYFYDGDWYLIETGEMLNLNELSESEVSKLNYYCDCLQKELDISLSINVLNLLHN